MQELSYEQIKNLNGEVGRRETVTKQYPIPEGIIGVNFAVNDGKDGIILSVDGRDIAMTIDGARELALALRQSANRVERERRH